VWKKEMYLRPGLRRPIADGWWQAGQDLQAALPVWWCEGCGAEVYTLGAALCRRCIRRKEDYNDGTQEDEF